MANVITKKQVLEEIKYFVENGTVNPETDVTVEDIVNYANTTIAQMEAKAAKAKEAANKKKAEDPLKAAVAAVLTNEYQTIADITAQIDVADVTTAKVTNRLTKLVAEGAANKTKVKTADGRTINGYAAGSAPEFPETAE